MSKSSNVMFTGTAAIVFAASPCMGDTAKPLNDFFRAASPVFMATTAHASDGSAAIPHQTLPGVNCVAFFCPHVEQYVTASSVQVSGFTFRRS